MQNNKSIGLKASQLLKNFSRNYQRFHYPRGEVQNLRMKSYKVAFTSRMLRTNIKIQKYKNKDLEHSQRQKNYQKFNDIVKRTQFVIPFIHPSQKKQQVSTRLEKEDSVFDFRGCFKKRILSPKILKISVNSSRSNYKQRSYSANMALKRGEEKNPQVNESFNSFQFTFGRHQKV